jgi:hypothetical protein
MELSLPHLAGGLHRRRERKLISARKRRALATALSRLIDAADGPPAPFTAAVPIQREAVRACRPLLLMITQDLEDTEFPVNARGVALVEQLLRDGASPVYAPLGERALEAALRHAHAALVII